jgi:pimeloyl-ACP methyl ester carboxylesterase
MRYRPLNPQGKRLVLGFHGSFESLEHFPLALEPILKDLDMQGIFPDRPGIGPVSTPWPGHDLADWARLVEEFVKKELDNQPVSIIGHSSGGVFALACAKLACVRALALVCSASPVTPGSYLKTLFGYDQVTSADILGGILMPHTLLPDIQGARQLILYDWKTYFAEVLKTLGPLDRAFVIQNEKAFRKDAVTGVTQRAEELMEDWRLFISPWPLTPADTARLPILIFTGADDWFGTPKVAPVIQADFAPNARLFPPIADMGHLPTLEHYKRILAELGKLDFQGKKILGGTAA